MVITFTTILFLWLFLVANTYAQSYKEAYANLKLQIPSVKKSCGEICDQSIQGKPGKYFDFIEKKVDCPALFSNPDIDAPSIFPEPPTRIPKWLKGDFTYQGRVEIIEKYYNDHQVEKGPNFYNFTKPIFDFINKQMDEGVFKGPYGKADADNINRFIKDHLHVKDQHVLIIGSETPWIELMALRNGAKHVTSIDYAKITNDHPQISAIHALDFFEMVKKNELPEIDVIISYSSIEHSGLGRYGDNLNPWGDLITMARAWCILAPGKKAMIGIPIGPGKDVIQFNGARLYGPVMLSHAFANWKQVYSELDYRKVSKTCVYCYQELFVLEK